jgi:hypothetical protein
MAVRMLGRDPKTVLKFKSNLTVLKICPLCNTIVQAQVFLIIVTM